MIHKSNLKGKYIDFLDKDGKHRTQQVTRVKGNFLTVKDVLGIINNGSIRTGSRAAVSVSGVWSRSIGPGGAINENGP